jgi:short-subunit dehydrogenase
MSKNIFNNKSFIISGVSSGIGKEIARVLIEKYNCKIYGIARNEKRILDFISTLTKKENFLQYFLFDVSVEQNWINLKNEIIHQNLKIDGIINCAGILPKFACFSKTDVKVIKQVFDVNFYSCIYSCKHIIPLLNTEQPPYVANIASSASLVAFSGISVYSASKSALKSFTHCLSIEYKNKINVSCICPGVTDTGIFLNQQATNKEFKLIKKLCTSPKKVAIKTVKAIKNRRKIKIIGYDAKLMNFFYKLAPNLTASIITSILKLYDTIPIRSIEYCVQSATIALNNQNITINTANIQVEKFVIYNHPFLLYI